jgi:hypothetical protein
MPQAALPQLSPAYRVLGTRYFAELTKNSGCDFCDYGVASVTLVEQKTTPSSIQPCAIILDFVAVLTT